MEGRMMEKALATKIDTSIMEQVLLQGDLAKLQPAERLSYYKRVCESLGLNMLTKPFDYINLNGKLTLYAKRDCTDQLRNNNNISISITCREKFDDLYVVSAKATTPDGRVDESIGSVNIGTLKGDALANALMKAETKAKRRVTLSICGLGFTDETEIETIPTAKITQVDNETGEILTQPQLPPSASSESQESGLTEPQRKKVFAVIKQKFGKDRESFNVWCFNNNLPEHTTNWTKEHGKKAIDLMEKLADYTEPVLTPADVEDDAVLVGED